MTNIKVLLNTNVDLNLNSDEYDKESWFTNLNDRSTSLLNVAGNVVNKGVVQAVVPEDVEGDGKVHLTLANGRVLYLDSNKYDANETTEDSKDVRNIFIKVGDAIVNKALVSTIFVVQ